MHIAILCENASFADIVEENPGGENVGEVVHHALLFADKAFREDNGKHGLIGIFHVFNLPAFPAKAPPFFVYAAFSNVMGKHEFAFNLVRDESPQVVMSVSGELESASDSSVLEIVIPVLQAQFIKPGTYTLTFNLGMSQVASHVLTVNEVPKTQTS